MPNLKISNTVTLDENEVEISAIWAQGSGGQKVNKVSAAIHLRFDIADSDLPQKVVPFPKLDFDCISSSILSA